MFTLGAKIKYGLIAAAVLAAVAWGGYKYVTYTTTKIANLNTQIDEMKQVVEKMEKSNKEFREEVAVAQKNYTSLTETQSAVTTRLTRVERRITNANITAAARVDPALVETQANETLNGLFRDINQITAPEWKGTFSDE